MLNADLFRSGRWHRTSQTFQLLSVSVETITETTITVRWRMSAGCTGQLEYGLTSAYGSTTTEETSTTYSEHVQTITGLSAGTTYHLRTKSTSAQGITIYSSDITAETTGSVVVTTRGPRAAPAVPSGSNVYTIPGSIASNDTGDVGGAISTWLNGLPTGSIALFTSTDTEGYQHGVDSPVATYRMAAGINVTRNDLTLWGYGTKINMVGNGGVHANSGVRFWVDGTCTIRGFEIGGPNTQAGTNTAHVASQQFAAAISIAGNNSVDVFDVWTHHTYGDGIFIAGWGDVDYTTNGPFEFAYNHIDLSGRYGMTINQSSLGPAWVHHNVIENVALSLVGGEDQRVGTGLVSATVEDNDLGTFGWYNTTSWLAMGINWIYDYWAPLPNMASVGPIIIRRNTWTGGCATAMFQTMGTSTQFISMRDVSSSSFGIYHDFSILDNDWTGVPTAQRTVAYWAQIHNIQTVTITGNTNLGSMSSRVTTTGSTGVTVSGNS
jgi:hypothetical protein